MQCCLLHLLRGVFPQQISHLFYYCCSRILLLLFSNVNKIQETRRIDILRSPEYFHCTPPPQLSNTHSTQKYKIRLIVNRHDSSNSFRKVSNRYIFKISNDLAQLKERACYIVLLEKTKKEGQNSDYLEIGKGEINLS